MSQFMKERVAKTNTRDERFLENMNNFEENKK